MTDYRGIVGLAPLALLVMGYLIIPTTMKAAETEDSVQITQLFADAKTEAIHRRDDSDDMDSFVRSRPVGRATPARSR